MYSEHTHTLPEAQTSITLTLEGSSPLGSSLRGAGYFQRLCLLFTFWLWQKAAGSVLQLPLPSALGGLLTVTQLLTLFCPLRGKIKNGEV